MAVSQKGNKPKNKNMKLNVKLASYLGHVWSQYTQDVRVNIYIDVWLTPGLMLCDWHFAFKCPTVEHGNNCEYWIIVKVTNVDQDKYFTHLSPSTSYNETRSTFKKKMYFFLFSVAPAMNLKVRGVTDRSVDLEWEGSVVLTDFLVTYTPSSARGKFQSVLVPLRQVSADIICLKIIQNLFLKYVSVSLFSFFFPYLFLCQMPS